MKKNIAVPDARQKQFKGYTVDEMRYKLLVNSFKIKVQQERLMLELMPPATRDGAVRSGWSRRLDTMINYGQLAFMAFTMARKIILPVHRYFSR